MHLCRKPVPTAVRNMIRRKNDWVIYEMRNVGTLIRLRRFLTGFIIVAVLVLSCLVTLSEAGVLDNISLF